MTHAELETLIDQRAKAQAEEVVKGLDVGSVVDAKAKETIENKVKEVFAQAEKDKNAQANVLEAFEKANVENSIKGLQEESTISIVNKMVSANLMAMQKFDKTNGKQVTKDELLAVAKDAFPMAKALHAVIANKDLNTTVPTAGGFTVPVAFSADYVSALYENSVLDKLGVSKVPLINGNLSIPKMTASAAAYWVGESKKITKGEPTFGGINLKAKKLGAICPISNDLLKYSGVGIEAWVMNDLRSKAVEKLDDALLNGTGTEYQPLGLTNVSGIGSLSGALAVDTPFAFEKELEENKIPMNNCKWILSPRAKNWLRGKAFASGPFAWAEEIARSKQIDGYDIITSGSLSNADNTHASILFGDFSQLLWGVGYDLTFEMSRDASYDDGTGTSISCFQNDQTLVKLITSHDFGVKHAKAFCKGSYTNS